MRQQKVGIVDYEMGNTKSVLNAIRNVGGVAKIISNPDDFLSFDKLILPGVGAFGKAMRIINNTGMRSALDDFKKTGNYILGICLGMQIMCSSSEEDENEVGLSWFPAKVQALEPKLGFNIPHMGWNNVDFQDEHFIFNNLKTSSDFYFLHGFCIPHLSENFTLGLSHHSNSFSSVISTENLIGVQFHPEKSQSSGLKMLKNFVSA